MSNNIIVRVQSPNHGMKRIQTKATERINDFLEKVKKEFSLSNGNCTVFLNRNNTNELGPSRSKTLNSYKIRHGDILFLAPIVEDHDMGDGSSETLSSRPSSSNLKGPSVTIPEDEVDKILDKMDGKIPRQRNEQLCHHGPQGKCLHCVPLEPYDETYLKSADPPIKFLSFHSYLRKLTGGVDKGKFAMLENISVKIKAGCTEHPPWPGGICTKCQPNAVTLNRQPYRHVDYIQFENHYLVDRFLNYWRTTGSQRIGIMYGRYEHHKDVPLGIKAVVAAIYEPPQVSARNSVELLEDDHEDIVNSVASQLELQPVGWIFTDLIAYHDQTKGTVKHFRGNIDSHFLSAEECIMAAEFQNKYPNPCKLSPEGHFGSKFTTVVVTGDDTNHIAFYGYQVSNQCMALVRDDCLIPTRDAPELGYVKESSNEQYVPDVFYKEMDKYGNEVTRLARPLPVEYLIVDLNAAFPVEPVFTFDSVHANVDKPFPIQNRGEMGTVQDFNAFSAYMSQFTMGQLLGALSDFHVLVYLATCDMLPLKEHISILLEAVRYKDESRIHQLSKTEEWATVQHLIELHAPSPGESQSNTYVGANASPLPPIGAATEGLWTCKHCTFINQPTKASCEMCSLPK